MARALGSPLEVFARFLRLGCTSFGGPVAHIGYFRQEFVERARWLSDASFGEAVALCSALPGPTSSQIGIVIGTLRAGPLGGLCAWLGFTTPSAIALAAFGMALRAAPQGARPSDYGWLLAGATAGLAAAAAGVVAAAVLALAVALCKTRATQAIGIAALTLALVLSGAGPQFGWLVLACGAIAGVLWLRDAAPLPPSGLAITVPRWVAVLCGAAFAALLVALPAVSARSAGLSLFSTFFRAGALVFGGGHVVLALLQGFIGPGAVPRETFFAGYGAAQAVPGPLFTFSSFLGAVNATAAHGAGGAFIATAAIFLPSFLLLAITLPAWNALRSMRGAPAALAGVNASVVGLLGAVLVNPIAGSLLRSPLQAAIALAAFVALARYRTAAWIVVLACAGIGTLAAVAHVL